MLCVYVSGYGDVLLFLTSERLLNHISTPSSFYVHMWEGKGGRGTHGCMQKFFPSSWSKNNFRFWSLR